MSMDSLSFNKVAHQFETEHAQWTRCILYIAARGYALWRCYLVVYIFQCWGLL